MKKIVKKIVSGALALGMIASLMPAMTLTAKAITNSLSGGDSVTVTVDPAAAGTASATISGSNIVVTLNVTNGFVPADTNPVLATPTADPTSGGSTAGSFTWTHSGQTYTGTSAIMDGSENTTFTLGTISGLQPSITISSVSGGSVTSAPPDKAAIGAEVTLTVTPATDKKLDSLTVTGTSGTAVAITLPAGTFTMPAEAVTVTPAWKDAKTVTVEAGNYGTAKIVSATDDTMKNAADSTSYLASADEKITLTATANKSDYTFDRWEVTPEGAATISGNVLTMANPLTDNVSVKPVFIKANETPVEDPASASEEGTEDGETTGTEDGETTEGEDGQATEGEDGQSTDGESGEGTGDGDSAAENPFTDVVKSGDNDPYYDAIIWAAKNNVVKGKSETTYDPNGTATRVEFTTMMHRLLKDIVPGNPGTTSKFADCQNLIEDFTNAILWAESLEPAIIQGVDANNFAPNAPITRAQVVTLIWRAAGSPEPKSTTTAFTDLTADYYKKAVAWGVEQGIVKGTSATTFAPDQPVTRAQLATFLYRAVVEAKVFSAAPATDASTDSASDDTKTDEKTDDSATDATKTDEAAEGDKTNAATEGTTTGA